MRDKRASDKTETLNNKRQTVPQLYQMDLMKKELSKLMGLAEKNKNVLHIDELNEQLTPEITDTKVLDQLMMTLEKKAIEIKYPSLVKNGMGPGDSLFMGGPDGEEEREESEEELKGYRNNDPVRLYLRKMGGVSLLDREGEVDIARRIEKGEREIIRSVLMCPMGTCEVIRLGDHLQRGRLKVKTIFRGLEDEEHRYNEKEYLDKIFELIGHVKKYQKKAEKSFLKIRDQTKDVKKAEKVLAELN
ncbi:MAG: RNA polymerase sigma factor RpoD, partial [Oligoflexia bacterium]|nr:RNA polymerase sigma factor RpoD [Oligoflexia bacterium]